MIVTLGVIAGFARPVKAETKSENDARMGWFREARLGMFIHWGLYAVPAGEWHGKKYGGGVEWIQDKAKIPTPAYTPLLPKFNPVKYDADAWVRLAREARMKYIVITSKHHDGFCLWPSAQTEWDIASKGGNYLLNVGPTGEGLIPGPSVERLRAVGEWMNVNGQAIHGTTASPFAKTPEWGRCTTRTMPDGNTRLYLPVFDWPASGQIMVKGLANEVLNASLLATPGEALPVAAAKGGVTITVPTEVPDQTATVAVLDVKGSPGVR